MEENKNGETALMVIENSAATLRPYDPHVEWNMLKEQAKILVKSGMLPVAIRTPEAAIAIMMTGREYGIGVMRSFQNIYFIKGALSMAPKMKYAMARKSGLLAKFTIKEGDDWVEATAQRKDDGSVFNVKYTMQMAQKAGLASKDNWKSFPQNMLRWRAIGYVLELAVPEIVGGLFSPDELGMPVDYDGNLAIGAAIVDDAEQTKVEEKTAKLAEVSKFVAENDKGKKIKELWKATKGLGVSEVEFRDFVKTKWGVESTASLSDAQLAEWENKVNTAPGREAFLGLNVAPITGVKDDVIDVEVVPHTDDDYSSVDDGGITYDADTGEVNYGDKPVETKAVPAQETKRPLPAAATAAKPATKSFPNI